MAGAATAFRRRVIHPLVARAATTVAAASNGTGLSAAAKSSCSSSLISQHQSLRGSLSRSVATTSKTFFPQDNNSNSNSNKSRRHFSRHVNEAIVSDAETGRDEGPLMADLRSRGVYSDHRYGHYHKYTVQDFTISDDRRTVTINWNDGHTSEFDAIWLRHNCHCKDCKHDTNGMGKISWQSLPLDITVLSLEFENDKVAVFKWATPDGKELHTGVVPTALLRCYCYSQKAIADRRKQRAMTFHEEKTIPAVEYEDFMGSEKGLHTCLTHVSDRGICVVKNTPTGSREEFLKTLGRIGPVLSTMYGDTFEVVPTPNPINAAYSSAELALHMDLVFYERPPGLQILHCWKFDDDIVGGANTFLDIHEVAHELRRDHPELFHRLATLPTTYQSIHYNRPVPVHMENQKTMMALNHLGELVSVTYHPMVQGPVELPKEQMMEFYEAYTTFYRMVSEHKSVYKFQFEQGDFLIFNNRRVLHGRDAFTGGAGRHLYGGYIELSDFHSHVQALHNKYGGGRLASRSGSHSFF